MRLQRRSALGLTLVLLAALGTFPVRAEPAWANDPDATPPATVAASRREAPDDPRAPAPARRMGSAARPQAGPFTSVQVNVDANGANILEDAANEPSIAVDPTQPNRIAIGWRQFDTIFSNFRQAGYAWSTDGGRTWQFPGVLTPGTFRSDPVLAFDANGAFYYSSLKSVNGALTTDLFRSTDGGASWSGPFFSYGGDKQWIQIDRTTGSSAGFIYQAWSTAAGCCANDIFNRSTDGGSTFSIPTTIPSTPIWGTMDIASNGDLWIAGADPTNLSRFLVARSQSAKNSMLVPTFEFSRSIDLGGAVGVQQGASSPNPAGLLGQVWLAIDPSMGPRAGWIYVVCSVNPPGPDPLDVHFIRSTDGGQNWSSPVRINDVATGWQWMATLSVAPTGRIDLIWNDTRSSMLPNQSELFYSSSADGGTTWSTNQQLSPQWDSHLGWPSQDKIGDYYHMISDAVGAHMAWAATFNFEQDVYYLRIGDYDCNANGVGDSLDIALLTSHDFNANGIPDECEGITTSDVPGARSSFALLQNTPNPFNPRTRILFDLPQAPRPVRLRIFDTQGRLVRSLLDGGPGVAGRNTVWWDGLDARGTPVASGLYVYRLETPGFTASRKMLLLR